MNPIAKRLALPLLRWVVALVVLWQSWLTFHASLTAMHGPGHMATLGHVRLLLSGAEIAGAVLFLVPFTQKLGGYLLLVIFALAIVIHTLHGDARGMETIVVYGAAVFACLAHRSS